MAKLSKSQLLRKSVSMIHSISCQKVRRTSSGLAAVAFVSNAVLDEGNCRKRKCVWVQIKQVNNVQGSPCSLGQQQSCRPSKPVANNPSKSKHGLISNMGLCKLTHVWKVGDNLFWKEISQYLSASQTWVNLHNPCLKLTHVWKDNPGSLTNLCKSSVVQGGAW
jgi:hypothetical protein